MPLTRRGALAWAGGGLVAFVSGAGGLTIAADAAAAAGPWSRAGRGLDADPRIAALSWAILAPNPHNRQPWRAELVGADGVTLRCDLERRLPETDPFDRQTTIGLAAFVELFRIAAAEGGHRVAIRWFPEGEAQPRLDGRPIAVLRLVADGTVRRDPLFAFARARRSNKEPFDAGRPVPAVALAALARASIGPIGASADPALVARLRDLTWRATLIETGTPRTHRESVGLIRIGRAEVEAEPDGIDVAGPLPELLSRAGLLTRAALADPASDAFARTRDMLRAAAMSATAHVWLLTPGNGRMAQAAAGRDWLRLNLAATALGLGLHPMSQALQESPEMADPLREVHRLLAPDGGRVQMLGRLGYGPPADPSPRWPVESRIVRT